MDACLQIAATTIDRIIDVFPASQQNQIRTTLSEAIKGVIEQNLFRCIDKPRPSGGAGDPGDGYADRQHDPRSKDAPNTLHAGGGKEEGNVPLDDAIMGHIEVGRIGAEDAFNKCINGKKFLPYLTREPEP